MEIMGLAIIVILIGLALLFATQYALKKPQPTIQTTKEKTIATNFITAMLNTNTKCNQRQISELIQDCALNKQVNCEEETNPCNYANAQIKQLLDKTINAWNKKYDMTIAQPEQKNNPLMKFTTSTTSKKACPNLKTSSGIFPLSVLSGYTIEIILDIC